MVAMLVYDIVTNKPLVWDIILLVALVVLQFMYILIPIMLVSAQKKAYKKHKFAEMDYVLIKINTKECVEEMHKDTAVISSNTHLLRFLTSYLEDDARIILIFNKVEFVCIKKDSLQGGETKLKEHLKSIMQKQAKNDKKK